MMPELPTSIKRLLILDDDALVGRTIKAIAESAHVEARHTLDHVEFFALLESWNPTHLAIDLVMPGMDGVQVMAELARQECTAGVIVTSGQGSRVLEAASRSGGWRGLSIIGVLAKPFQPSQLRRLLADDPARSPSQALERPAAANQPQRDADARDILAALEGRQFHLAYQPKVECVTGRLSGFEALIRWRHPEQGNIPPDRFIPVAEREGLIDRITDQVLDQGLAWLARTTQPSSRLGLSADVLLSVNLSARTLANSELMESIPDRCRAAGVSPSSLVFELTETSAMEDPLVSLDLLTRLRLQGFQLSIDDFGTGFSSMLQLVRLPFSEIKVDKSFVMGARDSQECRTVIRSIVSLGRSLGMRSTAEGLEDRETLDYLREVGCDFAQGYHIGRPMDEAQLHAWMATREAPSA